MSTIEQNLARVDLNLLISLNVLLQEKNVSRAAERLFLSQSAMSRTLQRLRDVFEDPLFTRTSKGLIPTVKALELSLSLPAILHQLNHIFTVNTFDPTQSNQSFTVSVPPLMSHALLLPFIRKALVDAPNLCISEVPAPIDPFKSLLSGEVDFAIHINKPTDSQFKTINLTKVVATIYARKNHPILERSGDKLSNCMDYNFADLVMQDDAIRHFKHPIDLLLLEYNLKRNITVRSSQLSILIQMLLNQDLLLIAPDLLGESSDIKETLVPVYQFDTNPNDSVDLYFIYHERVEYSPAHQWFMDKFIQGI